MAAGVPAVADGSGGDDLTAGTSLVPSWVRYVGTPIALAIVTALTLGWVFSQDLLNREQNILNGPRIVEETLAHLQVTAIATLIVLLIAIRIPIAYSMILVGGVGVIVLAATVLTLWCDNSFTIHESFQLVAP